MDSSLLIQRMLALRGKIKRRKQGIVQGDRYTMPISGTGFEFTTLREYQEGDDIRRIDWSSSARSGNLMTRIYQEQKNRNIMLFCDSSASMHTTSQEHTPWDVAKDIAILLGGAAHMWHDGFGCAHIDDHMKCTTYTMPSRGLPHIIKALSLLEDPTKQTASCTLSACIARLPRSTITLCITDGLLSYQTIIPLMRTRGPVLYIRVLDPLLIHASQQGTIVYQDPEDSKTHWYAPSTDRRKLQMALDSWHAEQKQFLERYQVKTLDIVLSQNSYEDLLCDFLVKYL